MVLGPFLPLPSLEVQNLQDKLSPHLALFYSSMLQERVQLTSSRSNRLRCEGEKQPGWIALPWVWQQC